MGACIDYHFPFFAGATNKKYGSQEDGFFISRIGRWLTEARTKENWRGKWNMNHPTEYIYIIHTEYIWAIMWQFAKKNKDEENAFWLYFDRLLENIIIKHRRPKDKQSFLHRSTAISSEIIVNQKTHAQQHVEQNSANVKKVTLFISIIWN